jgi:DNA-binding CsgD family transcriptional regulator
LVIRRAALLHDIGLVAVPSFVLHKPDEGLSASEWETLRLHPYYGERILGRVRAFTPAVPLVAAHHERIDGSGYHRGLAGRDIPFAARILAVADVFDDLTHEGPARAALSADEALHRMGGETGSKLDADAVNALLATLGKAGEVQVSPHRGERLGDSAKGGWPAGLSDREVEVLRLAARGLTRKQMADLLFLSPSTVRSHLEHIYAKIEVSSRAAATLFAVEHGLIP